MGGSAAMSDSYNTSGPYDPKENPYEPVQTPGQQPNPLGLSSDERLWGMLAHLAALAGFVIPFPGGNLVGPLVIWLLKREEMPFVDDQGKESLNFQITILILVALGIVLSCLGVGVILLLILAIYPVVMVIIAAVRANNGEAYRYPLTIRLLT